MTNATHECKVQRIGLKKTEEAYQRIQRYHLFFNGSGLVHAVHNATVNATLRTLDAWDAPLNLSGWRVYADAWLNASGLPLLGDAAGWRATAEFLVVRIERGALNNALPETAVLEQGFLTPTPTPETPNRAYYPLKGPAAP